MLFTHTRCVVNAWVLARNSCPALECSSGFAEMGRATGLTKKEKRSVLALRSADLTLAAIAVTVERSLGAVHNMLKTNQVPAVLSDAQLAPVRRKSMLELSVNSLTGRVEQGQP